jgi:hypothetical protein
VNIPVRSEDHAVITGEEKEKEKGKEKEKERKGKRVTVIGI